MEFKANRMNTRITRQVLAALLTLIPFCGWTQTALPIGKWKRVYPPTFVTVEVSTSTIKDRKVTTVTRPQKQLELKTIEFSESGFYLEIRKTAQMGTQRFFGVPPTWKVKEISPGVLSLSAKDGRSRTCRYELTDGRLTITEGKKRETFVKT